MPAVTDHAEPPPARKLMRARSASGANAIGSRWPRAAPGERCWRRQPTSAVNDPSTRVSLVT
jgi:hypothetical protein